VWRGWSSGAATKERRRDAADAGRLGARPTTARRRVIADATAVGGARPVPGHRAVQIGLATAGLAAAALGCFLPTADEASVGFAQLRDNTLVASGIGWLTLLLCGAVAADLLRSVVRREPTWAPLLGGILLVAQAVYLAFAELTTCPVGSSGARACEEAAAGSGLMLVAAGGCALLVAGVPLAFAQRARTRAPRGRAKVAAPAAANAVSASERLPSPRTTPSASSATPEPAEPGAGVARILAAAEATADEIVAAAHVEAERILAEARAHAPEPGIAKESRRGRLLELLAVSREVEREVTAVLDELADLLGEARESDRSGPGAGDPPS